jgi:O-antigen/teichoic acid export membrane protein
MIPFRVQARLWQTTNDYKKRTITEFLAEASTILLSIALIVIPGFFITDYDRALGRIVGASRLFIVSGSLFLINMLRSYKFAINFSYWKYALVFSIPVLPHIIGDQLLAQFDRVMIDNTIGRSEAGLYSFAYNIGNIVTWIYGGFAVGWMPWVFERMEKQDTDTIILRMRQIMIVFAGLVVLLMLVLPFTIPWVSGPAYAPSIPIIPIVVASGFFYVLTGLFGIIEWYEKKTVHTSLGTILATVVNIALNFVFIPRMGYTVAAWTTLISYILLAVVHYYISQKLIGFHLDKNLRIILLLSSAVIATVMLITYFLSM